MRLIHTSTFSMEVFNNEYERPPYAILSHCWNTASEEATYQDFQRDRTSNRCGKISKCCELARKDGIDWAWVDTCCIDKTSSAELTEAINSMYKWYEGSAVCYTFLPDIEITSNFFTCYSSLRPFSDDGGGLDNADISSIGRSRWFTRGWTLQELLAPPYIRFFNKHFQSIGTKQGLSKALAHITGIDEAYLTRDKHIREASVAARMSWASNRRTSRIEDVAYSLLGIFDVNMPLIYGEGNKAFTRLQIAIIEQADDSSILAWSPHGLYGLSGILAPSPDCFTASKDIIDTQRLQSTREGGFETTNKGIRYWYPLLGPVGMPKFPFLHSDQQRTFAGTRLIQLTCQDQVDGKDLVLHITRIGNKWFRAGVEKRRINLVFRFVYRLSATLLPYQRKYIATSNPDDPAIFQVERAESAPVSRLTSSAVYRVVLMATLTGAAVAVSLTRFDSTLLLRIGLLQMASEIAPMEMRVVSPVVWIAIGFLMNAVA